MKPIVEKILASGLIDRHMTKLLESWGYLPSGSIDKVREDALKSATHERLTELAEELAKEIDAEMPLKETVLDVGVTWPFKVDVFKNIDKREKIASGILAMVDRMGRFYFRIEDVKPEWIVPGYVLQRDRIADNGLYSAYDQYRVLSRNVIYSGDLPVAVEVTVVRVIDEMD